MALTISKAQVIAPVGQTSSHRQQQSRVSAQVRRHASGQVKIGPRSPSSTAWQGQAYTHSPQSVQRVSSTWGRAHVLFIAISCTQNDSQFVRETLYHQGGRLSVSKVSFFYAPVASRSNPSRSATTTRPRSRWISPAAVKACSVRPTISRTVPMCAAISSCVQR